MKTSIINEKIKHVIKTLNNTDSNYDNLHIADKIKSFLSPAIKINDAEIKDYLKHQFLHNVEDNKKSHQGKYYTPPHLVNLVYRTVKPYIKKESFVLDIAAGCGAFLDNFKENHIIARDIDQVAVNILKEFGLKDIEIDNSLLNVHRQKYGLNSDDHLVIVGNPPYNDTTSKNKKKGVNAKINSNISMDRDILTNDLGISFLRVFNKLKANVICVLHPLSYLIKETNFKSKLGDFKFFYQLQDATAFSSHEFLDTQKTPFPIICALYIRNNEGMNYEYIRNFKFKIFNEKTRFILKKIETIDGYIRKYPPPSTDVNKRSDIGLYMHNIRDTNSLLTSGNLTEKEDFGVHITINYNELYKYAYLNCLKRYFKKDFKFGNVSPIVRKNELENNEFLRDLFIIDMILNNQRLTVFNVSNKNSIIWTKSLINEWAQKRLKYNNQKPAIYDIFLNFVNNKEVSIAPIKNFLIDYFDKLKTSFFN